MFIFFFFLHLFVLNSIFCELLLQHSSAVLLEGFVNDSSGTD